MNLWANFMLRIAIVTGASVGLGKEYVRQLDQSGEVDEIWMVARRSDLLDSVAADLVHSKGRVFAADLTRAETMKPFYEALHREKHDVVWLVNNAGFGKTGAFDRPPVEVNLSMVDLNIRAMVEMTQRVLPHCRRGCHILQVGSSAGWKPMPNFSLYAATKSFVNSFAIALHYELADRGITVTAVCPGPVATDFFDVSSMGSDKAPRQTRGADPAKVVATSLEDARAGRAESVCGFSVKLYGWISPLLPTCLTAMVVKRMRSGNS